MNIGALVNYLSEAKIELDPMGNKIIEPLLKWLNAVFRREPASRWVTRPKSSAYYDRTPETSMPLRSTGDVLEAIRGVFQTVQIRFGLLTLNVDTATTAFWTPEKNLIEMLHATSGLPMHQDLEAWCIQYPQRFSSASSRLVGMFFNVKHLKTARNARKVKITRWSVQDAYQIRHTHAFLLLKLLGHFRTAYNITLKYPKLPLVVTKDGHFPVELCYSAPGERYKETLQGAETSDFIRFATAPAFVRFQQIAENVKKLNWPRHRNIVTGQITMPLRWDVGISAAKDWFRLGPSSCAGWGLMYFPGTRNIDDSTLQELAVNMRKSLRELGVGISSDMPSFLRGNPMGDIKALIAELMGKSASVNGGAKPRLLVFLLHQGGDRLYSIIKTVCDTLFGVASQVMVAEKALSLRGQPQYLANLRMNPPPPTFSALSASWDRDCARYTSVTSAQTAKTQLIDDFKAMAKVLLQRYAEKNNGSLPDSIVYYRDGLSEGEFNQILITEAAPLKELCAEYRGNSPKLTVVVCVKRHHTRLFPTERGDKNGNVLPGTVVENNSKTNDIYLVAHPGLQGTNRPTRYATLIDENNLSANDFQRMTNNICWSYARATCAVSIVAPVYYADQACERAKLHVREAEDGTQILGQVHKDLTWSMFWQ
ncbi:MAG: hypothetical protein M1832_006472 [Thelocarpon impressellum]|nr:MAG: hypothetical protein M1832_006472 [Thelocarpon impressellum]